MRLCVCGHHPTSHKPTEWAIFDETDPNKIVGSFLRTTGPCTDTFAPRSTRNCYCHSFFAFEDVVWKTPVIKSPCTEQLTGAEERAELLLDAKNRSLDREIALNAKIKELEAWKDRVTARIQSLLEL